VVFNTIYGNSEVASILLGHHIEWSRNKPLRLNNKIVLNLIN